MVKNMSGLDNIPRPKVCDIYDQVPTGVDRMSEAAPHILAALGEEVADDSELTPYDQDNRIRKISRLLIEGGYVDFDDEDDKSANKMNDPKHTRFARQVLGLMAENPFLPGNVFAQERLATSEEKADEFLKYVANHGTDGYPGLYGITEMQGRNLRRSQQAYMLYGEDSPHALTPKDVAEIIEEIQAGSKEVADE